ncbi:MAG TPA: right-handed parallel beta-helix repeat-containing protein [Planctomycetota bacterium]
MLLGRPPTPTLWSALGLLCAGIVLGTLARPGLRPARGGSSRAPEPVELATLELVHFPAGLGAVRGEVHDGDQRLAAELRARTVAGEPEQVVWDVRLESGALRGMTAFTLLDPRRSGHLWRWLLLASARREGLLALRATMVELRGGGEPPRTRLLVESPDASWLAGPGSGRGPLVTLGDDPAWAELASDPNLPVRSREGAEVAPPPDAVPLASLAERWSVVRAASQRSRALRLAALAADDDGARTRVHQAREDVRGALFDALLDVERLARLHALLTLFQDERALAWEGLCFVTDPASGRLEPLLHDLAPERPSARDPVPFRAPGATAALASSRAYTEELFRALGEMLRSDWVESLFLALEPELVAFEAALAREGPLPPGATRAEMRQRLEAQVLYLRQTCLAADALNHSASYALDPGPRPLTGRLSVRAWATTRSPVVIEGFRFANGTFAPAAGSLAPGTLAASVRGDGVVLPCDGRPVEFRFPLGERRAHLETAAKLTRALRDELRAGDALDLDVTLVQRLLVAAEPTEERLLFRPEPGVDPSAGRPVAPSLEQALARHPFLRHRAGRLEAGAGAWEVAGDLVLPDGVPLWLGPGTRLAFEAGAVLLASAELRFEGTADEPVVLEGRAGAAWAGVAVLAAAGRSHWEHVVVRDTGGIARGGWQLTGGTSFVRAPVTLARCSFDGTSAEDALNVVGTELLLEETSFRACLSDAFDGDFVRGELRACSFRGAGGDGLDVSGSELVVRGCDFEELGDKACSAGERSRVRLEGGTMRAVGVGIASKDGSDVEVRGVTIRDARAYALAAFVKKPEHGPARLRADAVTIAGAGLGRALAQTGCVLELDGVVLPTEDVDVEASYREGVLGRAR